jgi:hypothetical protein
MSGRTDRRPKSARAAAEPVESARERSVAMASSGASAAGLGEKNRSLERRRRPWRWWRKRCRFRKGNTDPSFSVPVSPGPFRTRVI